MKSKIIIIYQSGASANTKGLANIIANELRCKAIDVRFCPEIDLTKYDLVGFGSGIYAGRFGGALRKYIKKLNGAEYDGCKPDAFLFSTHAGSSTRAQRRFVKFLTKTAGVITLTGWSCRGKEVNQSAPLESLKTGINTKIKTTDAESTPCECKPTEVLAK